MGSSRPYRTFWVGTYVHFVAGLFGILLMAGEGLNHWVPHGREFHVPKHMMVMPESGAAPMSRAWYGIMVLPAAEAELQTGEGPSGLTYGDFKGVARRRLEEAEEEWEEWEETDWADDYSSVRASWEETSWADPS